MLSVVQDPTTAAQDPGHCAWWGLEALPEVLVARRGPRRPEALAEGAAQLAADDRSYTHL